MVSGKYNQVLHLNKEERQIEIPRASEMEILAFLRTFFQYSCNKLFVTELGFP